MWVIILSDEAPGSCSGVCKQLFLSFRDKMAAAGGGDGLRVTGSFARGEVVLFLFFLFVLELFLYMGLAI